MLALVWWTSALAPRATFAAGYDRPAGDLKASRSAVTALHGMVATSQPLATQAGLRVLEQGGNALDAAIAANAVLGVVEPMSCGIGGDLFCIYWDNAQQKLYGLNASGRSPYALTAQEFARRGLAQVPDEGALSWSVPGCVDGWETLRAKLGTLPLADLLAPAIGHAETGFAVSEIIAADWRASTEALSQHPDTAKTYLPGGRAPSKGELFKNPRLATTLRAIAAGGRDAFYNGPIAEQIVAFSRRSGGFFEPRDFAEHASTWVEPVSTNYRGYDIYELPPPCQGIAALQMLNLLEPYDLRALGHNTAELLHLAVEAKRLAYADRARYYADPEFANIPVDWLISKEYAAQRGKQIDRQRTALAVAPGDAPLVAGDTIYLCAVDKDRNCCSLIQSNYYGFGSKLVPGDLGFALQNRGALFSLAADHPNRYEPHKRPFHTIIPGFAAKDGQPWLVFGVMGGDMQPQGHVQALIHLIDFGMDPQQAADAARWRHFGSATPTGLVADPEGSAVIVESGISDEAVHGLRERGHVVLKGDPRTRGAYGGYQAILIDHEHGTLIGGSDPRKDGAASGY
jgi:gamma-glutamyltranspeptidase/glutathione hydrolase